jgi:hypothetical protein
MADDPGDGLRDNEDCVQANRYGEGGAVTAAMVVMAVMVVAMAMPVMMSVAMVLVAILVRAMIVVVILVMVVSMVLIMSRIGRNVVHIGSLWCCRVAQMSQCSRIQRKQKTEFLERFAPAPQILKDAYIVESGSERKLPK